MNNDLVFLYSGYIVSIILLIASGLLNPIYVIWRQYKQAEVKNGLGKLRKQKLTQGVFTEIVILVALFSLTARFFIHDPSILRYIITIAILFFSVFVASVVLVEVLIYNQSYTDREKELHELIAKIESGEIGLIDRKKKK